MKPIPRAPSTIKQFTGKSIQKLMGSPLGRKIALAAEVSQVGLGTPTLKRNIYDDGRALLVEGLDGENLIGKNESNAKVYHPQQSFYVCRIC